MKIGFDVDGVLANFGDAYSEVAREVYGKDKIPRGYVPSDWDWSDVLTKKEIGEVWKVTHEKENFWVKLDPFVNNVLPLQRFLNERLADVWYITARAETKGHSVAEQTQLWLEDYSLLFESRGVITVAKPKNKRAMLEAMGLDAFIDDHGPTVEGLQDLDGCYVALLDRPWNQDAKVLHRVESVEEFLKGAYGN